MQTKPNLSQIAATLATLGAVSFTVANANASDSVAFEVAASEVTHAAELKDDKGNEGDKDKKADTKKKKTKKGKKHGSCGAKGGCGAGSCG